ncbi:MAG: hypothetical protein ACI9VR_004618 [Cognaticolwellia sp.]|jgi:hypothetical protein
MQPLSATIDGHTLTLPAEPVGLLASGAGLALVLLALVLTRAALAGAVQSKQSIVLRILWGLSGLAAFGVALPSVQVGELMWALPRLKSAVLAAGVLGWLALALSGVQAWLRFSERDPEQPIRWTRWADLPVLAVPVLAVLGRPGDLDWEQL